MYASSFFPGTFDAGKELAFINIYLRAKLVGDIFLEQLSSAPKSSHRGTAPWEAYLVGGLYAIDQSDDARHVVSYARNFRQPFDEKLRK